jgi:hypothetical protein
MDKKIIKDKFELDIIITFAFHTFFLIYGFLKIYKLHGLLKQLVGLPYYIVFYLAILNLFVWFIMFLNHKLNRKRACYYMIITSIPLMAIMYGVFIQKHSSDYLNMLLEDEKKETK